jgi:hypothetical protein
MGSTSTPACESRSSGTSLGGRAPKPPKSSVSRRYTPRALTTCVSANSEPSLRGSPTPRLKSILFRRNEVIGAAVTNQRESPRRMNAATEFVTACRAVQSCSRSCDWLSAGWPGARRSSARAGVGTESPGPRDSGSVQNDPSASRISPGLSVRLAPAILPSGTAEALVLSTSESGSCSRKFPSVNCETKAGSTSTRRLLPIRYATERPDTTRKMSASRGRCAGSDFSNDSICFAPASNDGSSGWSAAPAWYRRRSAARLRATW